MLTFFIYLLTGILAGVISGLLGIGGGILVVPALYFQFRLAAFAPELQMQMAVSSSLAIIVVTALNSTWNHHRRRAVDWSLVRVMLPSVAIGSLIGSLIVKSITTSSLKAGFGWFEIGVAMHMWFDRSPGTRPLSSRLGWHIAVGFVVGMVSTLLGIGGGTISVPYLIWCGIPIRFAVATGAALGIPVAVVGASVLGFVSPPHAEHLPAWTSGLLYWPAIIVAAAGSLLSTRWGVHLAHSLPVDVLRHCFAGVLMLIGCKMLLS